MLKINFIVTILFFIFLPSCLTLYKVSPLGKDGYFASPISGKTISSKRVELDTIKSLLIVGDKFILDMIKNINYFDSVITLEDFEKQIILSNKQEEVGPLSGKIGLNNAYRKYKKFLYIAFKVSEINKNMLQLKLINPNTLDELIVAESYLHYRGGGMTSDQHTFNPLFNELIKYIRQNSVSFNSRYIMQSKK